MNGDAGHASHRSIIIVILLEELEPSGLTALRQDDHEFEVEARYWNTYLQMGSFRNHKQIQLHIKTERFLVRSSLVIDVHLGRT